MKETLSWLCKLEMTFAKKIDGWTGEKTVVSIDGKIAVRIDNSVDEKIAGRTGSSIDVKIGEKIADQTRVAKFVALIERIMLPENTAVKAERMRA